MHLKSKKKGTDDIYDKIEINDLLTSVLLAHTDGILFIARPQLHTTSQSDNIGWDLC